MSKRRGRRQARGRPVNGILVLDKPAGVTSNGALQEVKHLFKAAKAGHTGSLDPLATGVLPLCFGDATRFSQFLLEADKHYVASIRLGVMTNTGDADGEVIETKPVENYSSEHIESVLAQFRGEIEQLPSMYSALKVGGEPLYKLARQGIVIEREKRKVHIHELVLLEQKADELSLEVRCSKGTYVRSLAEDIGQVLGCGA
ncbi:MAG: tRNA pseudouridine(55) synthase TruB, partial [Gammaproteobacteria bacterium]|nr:tRNA pseudouridine(55) synthase TruB [Gammaproteobacteria bacterium]